MIFQDHYPICSLKELKETVATHNFFFFPIKHNRDIHRFTNLNPFQYALKIEIYLFVMQNVN
jgi:hypothetical protein